MMVRGLSASVIDQQKRQALAKGNIEELLRLNNLVFGGYQMMAKDDDDDDDDKEDKDTDDTSDDAGDDDSSDDDSSDDGDDTSGDDAKDKTVSKAEYDALMRRMKAADQRASKAEASQKDRERKEKTDLENAQSDLQTSEAKIVELQSELTALRLNNAFLAANTITWHNSDAALKLAQSDGYMEDVVDDDGVVDKGKLKSALQKLAKDHQYLVKKVSDDGGSSGDSAGGRSGNKDDKKATADGDARRAPSLRQRATSTR